MLGIRDHHQHLNSRSGGKPPEEPMHMMGFSTKVNQRNRRRTTTAACGDESANELYPAARMYDTLRDDRGHDQ